MIRLQTKLISYNLISKLVFTGLFIALLPYIVERINILQTDKELVKKREEVLDLISATGIEPFITSDDNNAFGSYNILKEEYISIEKTVGEEELNYIEESSRLIDDEEIEYRVLLYSFRIEDQSYLLEVGRSLDSIYHTGRNIRNVMLVFLIFIIVITFITDTQYTRIILTPLEKIKGKLKLISDPTFRSPA